MKNTLLNAVVKAVTAHIKKRGPIVVSTDDINAAASDGKALYVIQNVRGIKLVLTNKWWKGGRRSTGRSAGS